MGPLIAIAVTSLMKEPTTYKIVEVKTHSVFAGKLGDLVHEDLVLESSNGKITISVRGDFHTQCVHAKQLFHEGEMVRVSATDGGSVARESIRRA